jgi:hypothetical protein
VLVVLVLDSGSEDEDENELKRKDFRGLLGETVKKGALRALRDFFHSL